METYRLGVGTVPLFMGYYNGWHPTRGCQIQREGVPNSYARISVLSPSSFWTHFHFKNSLFHGDESQQINIRKVQMFKEEKRQRVFAIGDTTGVQTGFDID